MTPLEEQLLRRSDDVHRPSVENRVAFQWEADLDTLGHRNISLKDATVLGWLSEGMKRGSAPRAYLDVGCSYGNHVLMLNAMLGKQADNEMVGVDLFEPQLEFGRAFAAQVPGFENCSFQVADLEKGLPFSDDHFDVVNIADVLEHLVDPLAALNELARVVKPGGTIVISTPLKTSVFKTASSLANRVSRGRLFEKYYAGKNAEVVDGSAVMDVHAGHDHISEMGYTELHDLARSAGCTVSRERLMPVMSGSTWFDDRPFLLAGLMFLEAAHERLQRPSWAHGIMMELRTPKTVT